MKFLRLVLSPVLVGCSILLNAPFLAQAAEVETKVVRSSGNVRAELSYQRISEDRWEKLKDVRLKITRADQVVLDAPLPLDNDYDQPMVALGIDDPSTNNPSVNNQKDFLVRDLDGDREPEVIIDLYTGGAHCCTYSLIYRYQPAQKQYNAIDHFWGNLGYKLRDLDRDGVPEFQSADDRFAYLFTSYAASGYPLQIWQYRQGEMRDTTRQYPQAIYSHAYLLWQEFNERRQMGIDPEGLSVKGILAAYVADKYLLGQEQDGWQRVRQAYQNRDRQQYFRDLRAFLEEAGYIR